MQVIHGLSGIPEGLSHSAVAIGNFDGIHLGHRVLLNLMLEGASREGVTPSVLTFYPHPTAILAPEKEPTFLLTLEDRVAQLRLSGADSVALYPFTAEFASLSAESFIEEVLIKADRKSTRLNSSHVSESRMPSSA